MKDKSECHIRKWLSEHIALSLTGRQQNVSDWGDKILHEDLLMHPLILGVWGKGHA